MGQRIGDFRNLVAESQQHNVKNGVVTTSMDQTKVEISHNRDLVGFWTKFKAKLSHVPWVGRLNSLQNAKLTMDVERIFSDSHKQHDLGIVTGFMKALRDEYGRDVTSMVTRKLEQTGDKPLSLRTVKKTLENAEQLKKSMERTNQLGLKLFFDASILQGFSGARHENDSMEELLVSRGYKMPPNATTWKEMLGKNVGDWVERYISLLVKEHPDNAKRVLTSEDFMTLAREALAVLDDVKTLDGITDKQLSHTCQFAIHVGDSSKMAKALRRNAISDCYVARSFDRKNPESMLCQIAQRMAEIHGFELPDKVLKSISDNVPEWITMHFDTIVKSLDCEDTALSTGVSILMEAHSKIEALIDEHYEALRMIDDSKVLSEQQKKELREIATTRRMDPAQVRAHERFATEFTNPLVWLRTAMSSRDAVAFAGVSSGLSQLTSECHESMKEHGKKNWESGSVSGGDTAPEVKSDFVRVAIADLSLEDRKELYKQLISTEVRSMLTGFRHSEDNAYRLFIASEIGEIVDGAGKSIGKSPKEIETDVNSLYDDVPLKEISGMAVLLGTKGELDEAIVVPDAPHKNRILPEFSVANTRKNHGQEWLDDVPKQTLTETTGLSFQWRQDLGRTWMRVNGHLIAKPNPKMTEEEKAIALQQFMSEVTHEDKPDKKLTEMVSRLLNQRGCILSHNDTARDAFGEIFMGPTSTECEAWKDQDGNWFVRDTVRQEVEGIDTKDGMGEDFDKKGLAVTSVTYKIPVESIRRGNPQPEVSDSTAFFNF